MRSPLYITIPDQSVLSQNRELSLAELHHLSWVLFARHINPPLYDSILRAASQAGVKPRSVHHVVTAEEAAQELYSGMSDAGFLTRAGAWRIARNGLTMRPLRHPELSHASKLIARSDDSSRLVSEFARTLKGKLEAQHQRSQLSLPLSARKAT